MIAAGAGPRNGLAQKILGRPARMGPQDRCRRGRISSRNSEVVAPAPFANVTGRDAVVIHPPADTDFLTCPADVPREDYYLNPLGVCTVQNGSTLAIEACRKLGKKLVVIGSGQDEKKLRALARRQTSSFLGWQPDEVLRDHLRRCQALPVSPARKTSALSPSRPRRAALP